jgi:hypothetical protein
LAEIRNPNQQGGKQQDSRSLLVFALVFLVMLLALQYFRAKKPEPQPNQQPKRQQSATTAPAPLPADRHRRKRELPHRLYQSRRRSQKLDPQAL